MTKAEVRWAASRYGLTRGASHLAFGSCHGDRGLMGALRTLWEQLLKQKLLKSCILAQDILPFAPQPASGVLITS